MVLYRLNCYPTKKRDWCPNSQSLRLWPYLVIECFTEVIKLIRSLGWALIQYDQCPYKKGKLDTDTHREMPREVVGAEIRVPQKSKMTEAQRQAQNRLPLGALREIQLCQCCDPELSASRTVDNTSLLFQPSICSTLLNPKRGRWV